VKDILVVASFPEALELMVELLEQSGYSVRQSMTGAAALAQMFHQFAPVVVIDDDLPDFTGVDLSNHLKEAAEVAWGNKCITIAIRGDMVHDEVEGWAGTDHLILKPLNFDVFDALIADCCDARFLPISSRRLLQ